MLLTVKKLRSYTEKCDHKISNLDRSLVSSEIMKYLVWFLKRRKCRVLSKNKFIIHAISMTRLNKIRWLRLYRFGVKNFIKMVSYRWICTLSKIRQSVNFKRKS